MIFNYIRFWVTQCQSQEEGRIWLRLTTKCDQEPTSPEFTEMIGKYERGDAVPSIDAAKKIADAFEVSMDYLAGSTGQLLEKNMIRRINDIQQLPPEDKAHLFALMDAFLRDHKAKKVFVE